MSYYVHHVPGRLRVKSPWVKGDSTVAQEVEGLLRRKAGVRSAAVNTVTGSVLVNYDPSIIGSQDLLRVFNEKGYFDPSQVMNSDQYVRGKISQTGKVLGKAILGLVLEKTFEGSPLTLLTALI